ncbi:MAG: SusC/RagA family TonB-linked outer membrane protein [Dysgonamonadaceae bacterium]|jgi:TonB-linked SusC/RagA family outer membrane protein|nr:SusC/RagA family TonB-linked outer membrane protein [Dysgonamonadaceae bacterium]
MKRKFINICCSFIALSLLGLGEIQAQENKDSLINVAFGTIADEDLTNAVSSVNVAELLKKNYFTGSVSGLENLVGGYTGNLWGQAPLILVDGIPRNSSNVQASEIESVTFLKDASAVVLYGSRAAKGAILITTKRGKNQPMKIDFRANGGIYVPKVYPKYLDADCYMALYNEASRNDGIAGRYDAATIYHTANGTNPYRYPDIDFYSSDYLKPAYYKTDVTGEVYGGNDRTHYYLNLGMSYNNDLLKYGETKNNNDMQLNVRGNVDMQLTDWLKATTNTAVILTDNYAGRGDFWGTAATLRPNWFSPLIPVDQLDPLVGSMQNYVANSSHLIDGKYLLGGTSTDLTNAFADMLAAGYVKEKARLFMFDVGLTADLGMILQGLSFKTAYSMDYNAYYSEAWKEDYAVYEPTWSNVNGKDVITALTKYNDDKKSASEYVGTSRYDQTMSFRAQFDYNRSFVGYHNVAVTLLGWGYQVQNTADADHESSAYHRTSNVNLGLRAAYNYAHKYYFDFSGALIHSAKLPEGRRNALSPSVSLGWRISNENFFKDNISFVNDLKLAASYANLHQDLDISDYYMYKGYFVNNGGWYQWHDSSAGGNTTGSKRGDNPEMSFITREEFRVGLDASLFSKLVTLNVNYFVQDTKGLLTQGAATIYPSYFDLGTDLSFLPYLNYNNDRRTGVDFAVNFNKKFGEVDATLGFSGMYFASEATRRDEVYEYDYQYRAGRAIDATYGYVCEGFFQDQNDIDVSPRQTFGTVKPGDLKYKDINEDGVVDSNDQIDLGHSGNSVSPFSFGVNLTLKWKNFTLFAMGAGQTGAIAFKNSSYHWNRGTSKFSDVVWGRWAYYTDPVTGEMVDTRATATYPRLTTTNGDNNYRNSTFWMYKKNRFNLAKVQLTYDCPASMFKNSFIKGLSVYCNGDNLLVLSKESDLMETNIGSRPQCRFYNLGFKIDF